MAKLFWFVYALIAVYLLLMAKEAWAEESTQFLCENEQAASLIAAEVVISQARADAIAEPFINQKVCAYLPQRVTVIIVSRGAIYGTGSFRVQVVGIGHKQGDKPDFFALMKLNEGAT